jgi:integrase
VFFWLAAETWLRAGELAGLRLTEIYGERLTVSRTVWLGKEQTPKTDSANRMIALSPQLVSLLWKQIARQKAKGHAFLFTSASGTPRDMNVYRQRKLKRLLEELGIARKGFHAFRHFNVSMMDALRVPLKTIQERIGHALTGSFTLDVYGGQPDWERNLEAAQMVGVELEKAVALAETMQKQENESAESVSYGGLTSTNENDSGDWAS